jgi:hypothetical protein
MQKRNEPQTLGQYPSPGQGFGLVHPHPHHFLVIRKMLMMAMKGSVREL